MRPRSALVALLMALGCAPGASVVGGAPADASAGLDAAADASPLDAPDAPPPQCRRDDECADEVACTVDACRGGRCQHEPERSLCPGMSVCEITRGCRPERACAADGACRDDDPCTLNERCDPGRRVCRVDELSPGTACGLPGSGRSCRGGACQCPAGRVTTCDGQCVDVATDPVHCGRCSVACVAGAWCRNGACGCPGPQSYCPVAGCVDLRVDPGHCGLCGLACAAGSQCIDGRCVAPCAAGTHRCGAACLADDSPASCGARCEPCAAPANGSARCDRAGGAAVCGFTCAAGHHACGGRCAPDADVASCGARCAPCPSPAHGAVACVAGRCAVTCAAAYHLCGDRCLADADVASCGARCAPCPSPAHGAAACVAGRCAITCAAGYFLCGEVCSDGTSLLGCGASCAVCRVPLNGRAVCAGGGCGVVCDAGAHRCGDDCARDDSPASCGARCAPCPAPAHAAATCVAGQCGYACDDGYVRDGASCRALPRLVWPPSAVRVTARRPALRWALPPEADPDAASSVVELCRDRGCATVLATLPARGGRGALTADLPRGTVFWRLRAAGLTSAVWSFAAGGAATPEGVTPPGGAMWGVVPDFNGDGYDDAAVGMPSRAAPGPGVAVYAGGPSGPAASAAATLAPPSAAAGFGVSAAPAGDLNGDGYCDLAVGAPGAASGQGRVFVFLGGPSGLGPAPGAVITGPEAGADFGAVVAAAGDVNGDGLGDLLIGAPGAGLAGRAYVHLGSPRGVSASPSVELSAGEGGMPRFGAAAAGVGDLDGDGYGEVVVGADARAGLAGAVLLFVGGPMGPGASPTLLLTRPEGGRFGAAVAGVGDTDADGLPDFAAGAPEQDGGRGAVVVFHGAAGLRLRAAPLPGVAAGAGAGFGAVLAAAGDVDGDGDDELLVGAPRRSSGAGAVYVFAGAAGGPGATAAQVFEGSAGAYLGGALAGARDLDRDGFADALLGADRFMALTGRVTVLRGGAAGLAQAATLDGPAMGGRFGAAVASREALAPGVRALRRPGVETSRRLDVQVQRPGGVGGRRLARSSSTRTR